MTNGSSSTSSGVRDAPSAGEVTHGLILLVFAVYRVNKLTSVFYASVLLLKVTGVITLSKWLSDHEQQASDSA